LPGAPAAAITWYASPGRQRRTTPPGSKGPATTRSSSRTEEPVARSRCRTRKSRKSPRRITRGESRRPSRRRRWVPSPRCRLLLRSRCQLLPRRHLLLSRCQRLLQPLPARQRRLRREHRN